MKPKLWEFQVNRFFRFQNLGKHEKNLRRVKNRSYFPPRLADQLAGRSIKVAVSGSYCSRLAIIDVGVVLLTADVGGFCEHAFYDFISFISNHIRLLAAGKKYVRLLVNG